MDYVAKKHLKWGEETIAPGEPVPAGEEGRDYASLLRTGHIAETLAGEEMGNEELVAEVNRLTEEIDELTAPLEVPEDVAPGETRGWPVDEEGEPYNLPDPVRQLISDLETEVAELRRDLAADGAEGEAEQATTEEGSGDLDSDATETDQTESGDLPEGVKPLGGGYYELPDGSKVRGRKAVDQALAASTEDGEEGSGD